jgi:hypothetical protein
VEKEKEEKTYLIGSTVELPPSAAISMPIPALESSRN